MKSDVQRVHDLVSACRPLFAGQEPHIQSAALADLVACWLAGNVIQGDQAKTDAYREGLLQAHIELVRRLIPVNYKQLIEPELKRRRH